MGGMPWLPLLLLFNLALAEDVRDLVNAWKREYNQALELRKQGKSLAALDAAGRAMALAPASDRGQPAALYAELAGDLGDFPLCFNTLDPYVHDKSLTWEVWWNASITARDADYPATSLRYAREAVKRHPKPAEAAGLLLSAALQAEELDIAMQADALLPASAELIMRSGLVRDLVEAKRCDDARKVSARLPADPERDELLNECD